MVDVRSGAQELLSGSFQGFEDVLLVFMQRPKCGSTSVIKVVLLIAVLLAVLLLQCERQCFRGV
eukprot:1728693-Amphidinium_carterae.1